ncbi:TMAO reductase system periplasmic protein TorT [Kumtagia ephedrae]|uniref:TMAO reductase system periplasmic protein TorT n=1 Tax=Kumtagia ephedrae TaxID=2116701 RepID=A0A2P7SJJ6_9HYPH|nr:TMAO reductase system periplasmic protein TorT [Mesorhizobium ephedrae]PSJ62647.1 TMAO reductase system periplasmic protein TorT [Mesorhizobium ephedrae]
MRKFGRTLAFALSATMVSVAAAEAADWWPFKIASAKDGDLNTIQQIEYAPLEKAEKPWNLCVLFPHLQDSYWVSVNYGIVEEAKRLGVKVTVFQAGGYTALPKQISQYDDCVASGADAILISAISEAGVAAKIGEGMGKGIVNVAVANPILETPITARITPDFYQKGFQTGEYVKKFLGDKQGQAVAFPGPQGSGWAETYMGGFRDSTKTGNVKLLAEMFGEASVPAQLRLVEDALQTYPDVNVIWGGAPTAEAAIGAVQDAGLENVTIMSSYENQTMLKAVKDGAVLGFATEYPVIMGRIGVDLAVRALEKKEHEKILLVAPGIVTSENVDKIDTTQIFAPDGWRPEFSVK